MKIRKHSRILAFALALVMVLPLIGVPVIAADSGSTGGAHVNWNENFNGATTAATVLADGSNASSAKIEQGALRVDFAAGSTGKCYLMTDRNHAYEIKNAVYNETELVSGKVEIGGVAYTVSGPINNNDRGGEPNLDATLSPTKSGDAWIVTSERLDAWKGGLNIGGNGVTLKTPEVLYNNHSVAVYSVDYFISTDAQEGAVIEGVFLTGISKRFEMYKLKVNKKDGYVTLDWHEDAGIKDAKAQTLTTPLGRWFNVKVEIDLTSGSAVLSLNGEYAMIITDNDASSGLDIKKASFMSIISRGDYAPIACTGYYMIDNASLTTNNTLFYNATFDQYKGVTNQAATSGIYSKNFAGLTAFPSGASFATDGDDTYIRHEFRGDVIPGGEFDVDYYAYSDYTKWAENANIAFYDKGAGKIVLKDGSSYSVTAATEANISKGYYGTFKYIDDKTYALTSGLYAAGAKFGDGNIDKCISLRTPVVSYADYTEIYLSADYFIEPDSYGSTQSQFAAVVYYDACCGKVRAQSWIDLYNIDLATGKINRGGTLKIGEWQTVGVKINLVNGTISIYANGEATAENIQLTCSTNDNSGVKHTVNLNNIVLSSEVNSNATAKYIVSKIAKTSDIANLKGALCINNVKLGTTALLGEDDDNGGDSGDGGNTGGNGGNGGSISGNGPVTDFGFESETLNATPSKTIDVGGVSDSKVVDMGGNKVWRVHWDVNDKTMGDNGFNIDKNSRLKTASPISYANVENVILEAAYYIPYDAVGKFQAQFLKLDTTAGSVITSNSYVDIFEITFSTAGADATLTSIPQIAGTATANTTVKRGVWNTVSVKLNLVTGKADIYLNGSLSIHAQLKKTAELTNITIPVNQWTFCKVMKGSGVGHMFVDNVRIYEGTTLATDRLNSFNFAGWDPAKTYTAQDFSAAGIPSAPALAKIGTIEGGTALILGMGTAAQPGAKALYNSALKGEEILASSVTEYYPDAGYLVYNNMEYTVYDDGDGAPYIRHLTSDNTFAKYYVLDAHVFEATVGGGNVGKSLSVAHSAFSHKDTGYVLFKTGYFIQNGSTGIVESRFDAFKYNILNERGKVKKTQDGETVSLFQVDVATGKVTVQNRASATALQIDAWNTLELLVNLNTGVFGVYVNGVLAGSGDFGVENLVLGSDSASMWVPASVMPHNGTMNGVCTGAVALDSIFATAWVVDEASAFGQSFLSEAAFVNYLEGAIAQVDRASVRLGGTPGLRFASLVDVERVELLKSVFGAENVKMGTLIAPEDYMESFITDSAVGKVTRADLDAVGAALNKETYLDVAFGGEYYRDDVNSNAEGALMVGSILDILATNVDREFAGIGYIEVTVNGTVYGVYTQATMRCIKDVASAAMDAYDNGEAEYSDTALAVLNAYAAGGLAS